MTKRISISDKDYFLILGLKAKHQTDSIEEIIRLEGTKPYNHTGSMAYNHTTTRAGNPITKEPKELCECGHYERSHTNEGCLGDGATCACKQFQG